MTPNAQLQSILDWAHKDSGSLIVTARAGCGKTTALLALADAIVRNNMGTVFIGAYNRPIATELQDKLKAMDLNWREAEAGTMHSAGFKLIRASTDRVVLDQKKVEKLVQAHNSPLAERNLGTIKHAVSLAKQTGIGFLHEIEDKDAWLEMFDHYGLNDVYEDDSTDAIIRICQDVLVAGTLRDHEVIDYDDMIFSPLYHKLRVRYPYDWVMLDESQDCTAGRRQLALKLMQPRTGRMVAVGDDRQCIYAYAGVEANSMTILRERLSAKELPLTVTYRCPKAVVREANIYVPDLVAHPSAPEGVVRSARLQASGLKPDEVARLPNDVHRFTDFEPTDAVLCRNTAPLVKLAYTLIRAKVPCRVEGRDVGMGIIKLAQKWKVKTLPQLSERLDKYLEREQKKWAAKGREEQVAAVEDRVETLRALIDLCTSEGKTGVVDLVFQIESMFSDTPTASDGAGAVDRNARYPLLTLSTVHKSKGKEWDRVFILDREKYMPSPWAKTEWQINGEENLVYVAITRAKKELVYLAT